MSGDKKLAPITLFVYNRPEHTSKTLRALRGNTKAIKSDLVIFCDGPKNEEDEKKVSAVKNIVNKITGFKSLEIFTRDKNYGLANSVIDGVTKVINKYGNIIVLEDDIIVAKTFLNYMNEALKFYKYNKKVYSITGYNPIVNKNLDSITEYETYFSPRASSWGWGTWKNRWQEVDWEVKDFEEFSTDKKAQKIFNKGGEDLNRMLNKQINGQLDSWAIRWCYAHYKNNAYCLFPKKHYLYNIGQDGSGTHGGKRGYLKHKTLNNFKYSNNSFSNEVVENIKILREFKKIYRVRISQKIKDFTNEK
ncbi:MAG: sugar transferase [bacterium]